MPRPPSTPSPGSSRTDADARSSPRPARDGSGLRRAFRPLGPALLVVALTIVGTATAFLVLPEVLPPVPPGPCSSAGAISLLAVGFPSGGPYRVPNASGAGLTGYRFDLLHCADANLTTAALSFHVVDPTCRPVAGVVAYTIESANGSVVGREDARTGAWTAGNGTAIPEVGRLLVASAVPLSVSTLRVFLLPDWSLVAAGPVEAGGPAAAC